MLYEEVVRATLIDRPDRVALIPPIEDVISIE